MNRPPRFLDTSDGHLLKASLWMLLVGFLEWHEGERWAPGLVACASVVIVYILIVDGFQWLGRRDVRRAIDASRSRPRPAALTGGVFVHLRCSVCGRLVPDGRGHRSAWCGDECERRSYESLRASRGRR